MKRLATVQLPEVKHYHSEKTVAISVDVHEEEDGSLLLKICENGRYVHHEVLPRSTWVGVISDRDQTKMLSVLVAALAGLQDWYAMGRGVL